MSNFSIRRYIAPVLFGLFAASAQGRAGQQVSNHSPSFNCRYAKTQGRKLVCATPDLAALDRHLADTFSSVTNQGGINSKSLRLEENQWLTQIRDACADVACLRKAYQARIQQLLDESAKASSPAAYAETRPFSVDAALWAKVRAHIGRQCSLDPKKDFPDFSPEKDSLRLRYATRSSLCVDFKAHVLPSC